MSGNVKIAPDPMRVPEQGELVEVRRRQWLVSEVVPHLEQGDAYRRQDLVTLESIEEDSGGEQISVVWQIEPGARILEKAGLPVVEGYDSNDRFDAFLNAVRWGIATNVDRGNLLAPFRSGITIEDYQLDPLVRAIDMARVNLLIADDTGLGKTVEAGLVVQELLIRHRARSVLIVAPASDLSNWKREMREKFGLNFEIIDSAFIKDFRRERGIQANPWTAFPFLIASMDWIKQGEGFRLLKDALPPEMTYPRKFDILIVDEAHNVAPSGRGQYAKASLRTKAIQRLAPHFTHHLFLSATPHNGYKESFTSLLELLDNQRFARTVEPTAAQLQQVMVRRLKSNIVDKDGNPVFPKRELLALEIDYSEEERRIHALLKRFMDSRLESTEKAGARFGTAFVMLLLKKRLFSSPAAFAKTIEKYRLSLVEGKKRKVESRDEKSLYDAIQRAQEDAADEREVEDAEEEAIGLNARLSVALTPDEERMLDELCIWARKNSMAEDTKAKAILKWLDEHLKTDGELNNERVILFTEFMDTHTWLKTILAHHGYGGDMMMELHGSLPLDKRDAVINAFQAKPGPSSPVRILLATDAASEGINLHNFCKYMIHVEIPWNPNVMEQRNGRIDRHGQKAKSVYIWHPVGKGFDPELSKDVSLGDIESDGYFLLRAAKKVDAIREDLGCVGGVLNAQIQDAMLGKSSRLDADVQNLRRERAKRMLALEKELSARIAKLHENLVRSRKDANLTPENVRKAVETALQLAGKPALEEVRVGVGSEGSESGMVAWKVPIFTDSWREAAVGLPHPHTGEVRPVTFDGDAVKDRDDIVLAHLNHSLVRMSLRLLREEVWKSGPGSRMNRVALRSLPGLEHPMVYVWSRLLIVGGDHLRLHEELTYSGGELKADTYRREPLVGRLQKLLEDSKPVDSVPEQVFDVLKSRFAKSEQSVINAYEARSRERLENLLSTLDRREKSEIKDVNDLLDELENNIRKELDIEEDDARYKQLTFEFADEDIQELKRDFAALKARLDQIPAEREKEIDLIKRHYSDPRILTFPAAVMFLIPEKCEWGVGEVGVGKVRVGVREVRVRVGSESGRSER